MARILIAEDEASNRLLLKESLEFYGHEVTEAVDGVDALDKFAEMSADLVITDILMPRKGGVDLIKEIRWLDQDVRIVAVAAMGEVVLSEAREVGADRTLVKPFRLTEVLRIVEELLEGPQ